MEQIDSASRVWFDRGVEALSRHPCDPALAVSCFSRALFLQPRAATLYLHRGEAFFRLLDFRSALLNFRRAHALDPSCQAVRARLAQLHFVTGRLLLDQGEARAAVARFSEALALHASGDVALWRVKAWIKARSYGQALQELNAFITHDPNQPDGADGAGGDYPAPASMATHQMPNARAQAAAAAAVDLEEENAQVQLEQEEQERMADLAGAQAEQSLDFSAGSAPPTLLTARGRGQATTLSLQRTVQALILRAKLHVLLDRSELALRDAGWAHHLAPDNTEVRSLLDALAQKAEFLYGSALAHLLAGRPDESEADLTSALQLNPSQVKCLALRADLRRKSSRYDDALSDLKAALSIAQATKQAKRRQQREQEAARELAAQQEHKQEMPSSSAQQRTFVTATEDDEDDDDKDAQQLELEKSLALTFNGLGVQYYNEGHFSHGISCLSKAIELCPRSSVNPISTASASSIAATATAVAIAAAASATAASFFSNRGDCHHALGETDAALSDYHVALSLDAGRVPTAVSHSSSRKIGDIHASRGRDLFNRSEYEAAEAECARALLAAPQCGSHHLLRARVLHQLRKFESAYRDAERAVDLDRANVEARTFLLQLRAALLRPADLARAPPLPPLPAPDQPWSPSPVRPLQASERLARQREAGQAAPNGSAILALVYGGGAAGAQQGFTLKQSPSRRRR